MNKDSRIKRGKVVLGKSSLGELVELQKLAAPLHMDVYIGCTSGSEPKPYYAIFSRLLPTATPSVMHICMTKENALKRLVELSAQRLKGDTDGDH